MNHSKYLYSITIMVIIGVLLTSIYSCTKNNLVVSQSDHFIKFFGGTSTDAGTSIAQTVDGGYILAGQTASPELGADNTDMYIVKINKDGNEEWNVVYGGSNADLAKEVLIASDGNYVIIGDSGYSDGKTDILLVKVSQLGNIMWTKTYGTSAYTDHGVSITQTSEGGFFLGGYTSKIDTPKESGPEDLFDYLFIKVNSLGTIESYLKSYGSAKQDILKKILIANPNTDNKPIAFLGTETNNSTFKINIGLSNEQSAGPVNPGSLSLNTLFNSVPNDIKTLSDGYLVTGTMLNNGNTGHDIFLLKVNNQLSEVWAKIYPINRNQEGKAIVQNTNGILIAGTTTSDQNDTDIFLVYTNSETGDTLWTKQYGGEGNELVESVIATEDEGFCIIGSSVTAGNQMVMIIKLHSNGTLQD